MLLYARIISEMKENTNQAIVLNSIILYVRLGITAVCGLITTRFALQALGADDFGLFSVIGGIISFISIINTIMSGTSNRFIATAIGRDDAALVNQTFNVNFVIHACIAILILLIAYPLGKWYVYNFVNYNGDINSVFLIYLITILGSVISFIGVPYNGLLLARERFVLFSSIDVVSSIFKLLIAILLVHHFENKLAIYSITLTFLSAYPTFVYWCYCKIKFPDTVRWNFVRNWTQYKSVLGFSVWVGYGALATVGKSQGAALLVNAFFNTIMNTALGIANTVNGVLLMFSSSITKSISPQITKSYAAGNYTRSENLVIMASKVSFFVMFVVSVPFLLEPVFIFKLWLGRVPEYVVIFTYLIIVDALIGTLNAGIPELIFAMGNIKWYQIIVNTLFLASIGVGFIVLKSGAPAYSLLLTYIIFSFIVLIIRQFILNRMVKINNWRLIKESYMPSLLIALLFSVFTFIPIHIHPLLRIILGVVYAIILICVFGFTKRERQEVLNIMRKK